MAGPGTLPDRSYEAEVSLIAAQHCVVVFGASDGKMKLPAAVGARGLLGVLQDDPALGSFGKVRKFGISTVIAHGNITRGDWLEVANSSGHVQTLSATDHDVIGCAEMSASDGDKFEAFIQILPLSDINTGS
jgi:hypothetical protein